MSAHAKRYSASASARWLECGASVYEYEQNEPDDQETDFAKEGSCAHLVHDVSLQMREDPIKMLGNTHFDHEVTREMVDYVQESLDYVYSFYEADNDVLYSERKVSYKDWISSDYFNNSGDNDSEGFGTSDAILIKPESNVAHIFDLKYGKGIQVFAKLNTQGMLYGLGVYALLGFIYDIEKIVIHIMQPRLNHFDSWEITIDDLLAFGNKVLKHTQDIFDGKGQYNPGEKQCRWCDVKATCKALNQHSHDILAEDFAELCDMKPKDLNHQQLKDVHDNAKLIKDYLEAVEHYIMQMSQDEQHELGYKMVEGKSNRKLKDDAEDYLYLLKGEEIYTKKLKTLTDLEKLVGKTEFKDLNLTTKPPGKPTLVPLTDKRKPINDVDEMFDGLLD